jgi:uncharacterized protein (TIGR00369 family)
MIKQSRTIEWEDPEAGFEAVKNKSGMDYLNAMNAGSLPLSPLVRTLDFRVESIEKGKVVFSFIPQGFHYNPIGSVHVGVLSSLLDSAMGCTLHSVLEAGSIYTTLELKVNFLKAATIHSGKLLATGKLIHTGQTTALVESTITDEQGRIFAHGTSTCLIKSINK